MGAHAAGRTYDDADIEVAGISLRCLAYALPLSLLSWMVIFLGVAAGAGFLKL
jgi:hypothetical protein